MSRQYITHRRPGENIINPVADFDELRLVGVGDVEDRSLIFVEAQGHTYYYDYESAEAESAPNVISPTGGPGAWISTLRGVTSGNTDHNELGSLQGGSASNYFHLEEEDHDALKTGLDRGGFRLKWSQEETYAVSDTGAIEAGEELLMEQITADGDLVVDGTLTVLSSKKDPTLWRRRWSQEKTVAASEIDVLPADAQLIVLDAFVVDGDLDVQGDLFILPSRVIRQRSVFVDAQYFLPVDGFAWTLNFDNVANVFELDRAPAAEVGIVSLDFPVESSDGALGIRPTALVLYYSVITVDANDVTTALLRVNGPGVDTVGAGAKPVATALPTTVADVQHDTAGERGAVEDHALELSINTPDWLSARETLRLIASFDAQATTDITVRGALLRYDDVVWP
jgi:hypothetical protein